MRLPAPARAEFAVETCRGQRLGKDCDRRVAQAWIVDGLTTDANDERRVRCVVCETINRCPLTDKRSVL